VTASATNRDREGSVTPASASTNRSPRLSTDHAKNTQMTPRSVSPVAAARSLCCRPWPRNMSSGKTAIPAANTTVPAATAQAGHAGASTMVHHGTPNSSARMSTTVAMKRPDRPRRPRRGRCSTASDGVVTSGVVTVEALHAYW
jgi:hypothetical protein